MGGTEEGERSDLSLGKEEDRRGDYARLVLSLWLVTEGAQRRASPGRDLMLTHYFYFFWGGWRCSRSQFCQRRTEARPPCWLAVLVPDSVGLLGSLLSQR